MVQQTRTTADGSGNGVIIGILLAVVIAVGAYFFLKSNDNAALEPAAGIESTVDGSATTTPPRDNNAFPSDTAPAPTQAPAR